jgi:eukaryotic-like serine/threonine-protein kinase
MASSSERWQQIESLFHEALELAPDARAELLDQRCAGDPELRKEVETLLASAGQSMDFLHRPVQEAVNRMITQGRQRKLAAGAALGHYKIVSLLGAGGMGEVYLAEDTRLRRKVALKTIAPDLTQDVRGLRRFEQEAQAASALNHPNILTIYEFGEADGIRFIASEFIEGATLRQKLTTGRMDVSSAIDVAIQMASALAAAHDHGIVHRDIKPENVIVRSDGIVKILDFGIAKLGEARLGTTILGNASAVTSSISQTGLVLGTARYMSPEQARGADVDGRSDIFSLGSVIYELITGHHAFEGGTASDVIAEILKVEPPAPVDFAPDLPYEVERIIGKALRKDRANRYQSVRDLLIDLQDFKKESEFQAKLQEVAKPDGTKSGSGWRTPARGIAPARVREKRIPRGKLSAALAVVLIAAAGTLSYFYVRKANSSAAAPARSMAVLPFQNLKPDPETDFLGFSLADEIITKLSYVGTLNLRPSSSVDKYRNQVVDPKKVSAELNVDTLLTGTYIKDGDDLRITTQMIDVKSDKILWRDAIDVKYDKLLTVQDRVAQQIIKELELDLSPSEAANLKPEKPISALAYEYYLRGIDLYSLNQFSAAVGMLEKSTALDPNYAPAWAHLGRAYTTSASLQFGGSEEYGKAQAAYEKAIALNPALVEPRIYLSNLFTDTGRVEQAVPLMRSVLRDSPHNAEAHWELGYAYRFGGMLEESVSECEKARQNNPQVKINSSALTSYLYLGEYDKFLQSLPANDLAYILFYRGFAEFHLNRRDQAAADFDRAYEREPSLLPAMVGKALSFGIKHENAEGLKLLNQTESKIEERGVSDAEGLYKVAQAYAVLGDKASALHMLRHSIGGGFFCYPYFVRDPLLQNLRNDTEFKNILEQARQRHEQFRATFF